jgi:hypothetical protein
VTVIPGIRMFEMNKKNAQSKQVQEKLFEGIQSQYAVRLQIYGWSFSVLACKQMCSFEYRVVRDHKTPR